MIRCLTVKEAAAQLRVCERTVRDAIRAGSIDAYRIGNSYRIPEAAMWDALRVRKEREKSRDPMPRPSRSRLRARIEAERRAA